MFERLGLFKDNSYKDIMSDLAQAQKVKLGSDSEQWLYIQLPEGIQELLQTLSLMPKKEEKVKRKRGRPKKVVTEVLPKRKPGRPKGSKNKPKTAVN